MPRLRQISPRKNIGDEKSFALFEVKRMATIDGMTTENWVAHYVGHKGNSGNNAIVAKIESLQAALNRQIEADELKEPNMTRVKPLVIMILLGCVVALQVTILRGNFGEGMQRASEGFWGINRCN
jgi:hypothetical protein